MSDSESPGKYRRQIGICRIVVVFLCVVIVALVIALAVVASRSTPAKTETQAQTQDCSAGDNINLDPPQVLPPFHDLTQNEIRSLKKFLYGQTDLNLAHAADILSNNSYIFTMELYIPNKKDTLNFLDKNAPAPIREAYVVIFRGDKPNPVVEEYIVGPLPNPTNKKAQKTQPFLYRPWTSPEIVGAVSVMHREINNKVSKILQESYGGKLGNCEENCLEFQMANPMSPTVTGEPKRRKQWFWLTPIVEFWSLHPLDFLVLMDLTSNKVEDYFIDKIFYGDKVFSSLDELMESYDNGTVTKTKIPFPEISKNLYSSMNRRGKLFPSEPLLPPIEYEPSGKRYSINGRHIKYMGWDFDVRMSTISGPQIFDIRYNNERIVYELSLQELAAFYSSASPAHRFSDYVDSVGLIGARVRSLVSGGDCPSHSTYLSMNHVLEGNEDPVYIDRAYCVFEHNTGKPLRRHLSSQGPSKFYEGMMDVVLTVRTIATVVNYDYIMDFIFHQNGAVEVQVISTGYILTSFSVPAADDYGFRLREHITGNLHHHMFHYKVDMDIHGTGNRFEVLNIVPTKVDNSEWSVRKDSKYSCTKMVKKVVSTEKEAALTFNFDKPNYLTFYNNNVKSSAGVPRAYRLMTKGMSKQLFEKGSGQEPSVAWARNQVAVTKYKEGERRSSSMYAIWDAEDPVVNFQKFIDDDESIKDEDQVTWVTMGIHHIPHMEDFPVTPTIGLDLSFLLIPNNYFDEDPAMGSGDAIRIQPNDQQDIDKGIKVETYGKSEPQCKPRQSSFVSEVKKNPGSIFDQPTGEVVI
ncbi:putative amine oxidase [copper-containing] [Mercenaria mercenaria]|uniref:putative amine oxidase [copper-containing] n=1 Tax=Mercenaria mercenaria TaxID=6596 RepID=UPI00234EC083|nr:putative amine oxidase [copper-containing] [Mercenaria mercenaria]